MFCGQCCGSFSRRSIDDTLNTARNVLDTSSSLLSICSIPGLELAAKSLSTIISMVLQTRGNDDLLEELADNIRQLAAIIQTTVTKFKDGIQKNGESPTKFTELEERVTTLVRNLDNITSQAGQLNQGWFLTKCFHSQSNADTLSKLNRDLQNAIRNFSLQGQLTIEMLVISDEQRQQQMNEAKKKKDQQTTLESLLYVNARYASSLNPTTSGVLEGTRKDILDDLAQWTSGPDQNGYDPLMFVLSGGAGTGKSTIAFEIARRLDNANSKSLGASFFFVRGVEKLNTTRYVLQTLAYQLAISQPELRPHLVNAARTYLDQGKHSQQLEFDLKDLIIDPLKNVTSHHRVIIILDALDECTESSQDDIVLLLYLFMQYLPTVPFPLRILVTTRPEMRIEEALDSVEFRKISKPFRLQDIPMTIVSVDIAYFLRTKMGEMRCWGKIRAKHPDVISALTERAAGLFIYAATVIRAVGRDMSYGVETIDAILSDDPQDSAFSLKPLDKLYLTVLRQAFSDEDLERPGIGQRIQVVLGSLALLQDCVSANVLGKLLSVDVEDTERIVRRLGSVIIIPKNADREMRMLHASFPQFLVDEQRCNNPTFYIDSNKHHNHIARHCLEVMTKDFMLTENICKLEDPLLLKKDIQDLQERMKNYMPAHLQYACIHWATHLTQSEATAELLDLVEKFTTMNLLPWIEALSYMNRLEGAVPAILATLRWWSKNVQVKRNVPEVMNNAYRFILEFFTSFKDRPSEIYNLALSFSPHCELIRLYGTATTRNGNHRTAVRLLTPRKPTWGPCLRVIETNGGSVHCSEFSPDGHWIASGSNNGDVYIWDSRVGTQKHKLIGHTSIVYAIAWAPDGRSIVSGSKDGTLRVWNVASGAETRQQIVKDSVKLVAWNETGEQIISATTRGVLQVWGLANGKSIELLVSISGLNEVNAISKDCSRVVDVDNDVVRLWDVEGGRIVKEMTGHRYPVSTAVFLLDDTRVASFAPDEILVWDVATGNLINSVQDITYQTATSSSKDVVAACDSYNISLWDTNSWKPCGTLTPLSFSGPVSFSPDGSRLVSSSNSSIQIWDMSQPIMDSPTEYTLIKRVIFSLDGSRIAALTDESISIWSSESKSGDPPWAIDGLFAAAALSPDAKKLAVIDKQYTICLWSLASSTATFSRILSSEMEWECVIAWSPDGCWIASMTGTGIGVLDAVTGKLVKLLDFNFRPDMVWTSTFYMDFSTDSTLIYLTFNEIHESHERRIGERIYKWTEGENMDVETFRWKPNGEAKFSEEDGWIVRKNDGKMLCWLPPSSRSYNSWQGHNYFVTLSSGQPTILYFDGI